MQKKLLLPLIITLFVPFLLKAEWIPLIKQNTGHSSPNVTLISDDHNSTVIKIEISGFELKDFILGAHHYQMVDLLSESFTAIPGYPELPYIAKVLAIPDHAGISVEVLETGDLQSFYNINLPPARESFQEGSPETPYSENSHAYQSVKAYPGEFVQLDPPSVFRDFRITRVSVFPLRYIPANKELQAVSSVTVRISYGPGEVVNPKTSNKRPIAPSFGKLYRSLIFNYSSVLNDLYGGKEEGHELMLCIMPDEFVASFEPYAEWKRLSGIDIHITKFSDIGANSSNADIIKNHTTDAFHNWDVPPTYVLMVGDDGVFPKQICSYGFPNEDFFVEIDGNDFFPEMFIGRITNQSDYGLQVMINKFLKYEKTPYTSNTDWFKKGICCSNDAYASQIQTKRFAAQRMLLDGGFTTVDTMMSDPGCTYNVTDVVNAINNGRSFLNYRGEGWSTGWWATCTPMTISNLSSLNNGEKFTFVTSIGCGVAMFQTSGGNCFGEEWLEMGTLSSPEGAIAFIGPTGNTHTTYNNKIDMGIYMGMFQEGLETPGQALVRGKLYMYTVFGNQYYVDYHYKIFCVLGDPSIHIWKDVPQAITVDYPAAIPFGNNLVEFTVTHTSTTLPVTNALVCVSSENLFSTGYTDSEGKAYVEIDAQILETLDVTVRGGNVIPFQGTLIVMQPSGPYVIEDSYVINDAAGGNGNGLMDYGETNLLSITMKNVGVEQAENVVVTLSTINTNITITDSTANYGNIAAGTTAVVTDGFAISVAGNIPDLEPVSMEVTATDGSDTWFSYISIEAHSPVLEFLGFVIADPAGNNNGKIDPGETVDITINIENSGSSGAFNVSGVLTENDPFVTINTSQMSFGNISGGSQADAVYSVTAAFNTPAGHLADLSLGLNADLGITGAAALEIVIGQIPVLILDLDENGNSAPDMETALNTIDIAYEKLTFFPPDLHLYSTIFLCLGVFPSNHVLNSSEGQTLANYLNDGGSLYMEGADTWCFDQGTTVHGMFNIIESGDGTSDMETVAGIAGTFTEGMSFNYNGDNSYMDHIEADPPAFKILNNQIPFYGTAVAYDAGDYKTIGTGHEFGGLQDGTSPSTKEELMAAYLEFLGISTAIQATFNSNVTQVCENNTVNFYDQSSGGVISWQWTFEGGNPATSIAQNPTVYYSTPGSYDVTLTVSDGVESSTLTLNNYITVSSMPGVPGAPAGPNLVCLNVGITDYSTTGLAGITNYDWLFEPSLAGNVTGTGLTATIIWANGYLGDATLKVAGENVCGTGTYSTTLNITRYLPDVTLEPFDWVCLDWPAFELSGGLPVGGEYSGPGVENGWFNPAIAGIGTHTITYIYNDPNNCENFATETILVDPCTGMNDITGQPGIKVYPNPSTGMISIGFDQNMGAIDILVVNTLNSIVYSDSAETTSGKELNIDLSKLAKGIYFMKLKTDKIEKTIKIILQ
jgi:PKD repeat protein